MVNQALAEASQEKSENIFSIRKAFSPLFALLLMKYNLLPSFDVADAIAAAMLTS